MTRNQLPEGVGKKIVEALKRANETDITPMSSNDEIINSNAAISDLSDVSKQNINFEPLPEQNNQTTNNESFIIEDNRTSYTSNSQDMSNYSAAAVNSNITGNSDSTPAAFEFSRFKETKEETYIKPQKDPVPETPIFKAGSETTTITFNNNMQANTIQQPYSSIKPAYAMPLSEEVPPSQAQNTVTISIPTNVAVLKNLIASLPVGVTKQTGAQIIRQTLEAMGLPMANVLKEAQEVQEELNTNTRECMLRIQEFKTNIMQLEQSVQEYQKNITQINDLVSLFLLTDRRVDNSVIR